MSEEQSTVEYREIKGFPGYRVGDDGSVWSFKTGKQWKKLRRHVGKHGYCRVTISPPITRLLVHRLVLTAFVGPCPDGMECRHFPDFDRSNCRLSNLQWGTRKQNIADKMTMGRQPRGETQGLSVLTEKIVSQLRAEHAAGIGIRTLARKYKLDRGTIHCAIKRRTWKHVA